MQLHDYHGGLGLMYLPESVQACGPVCGTQTPIRCEQRLQQPILSFLILKPFIFSQFSILNPFSKWQWRCSHRAGLRHSVKYRMYLRHWG